MEKLGVGTEDIVGFYVKDERVYVEKHKYEDKNLMPLCRCFLKII